MTESSLHSAIKSWVAQPGDSLETSLDGYIVDILRGDLIIEIQTRSFSSLRPKLENLLSQYPVHVVHPIAVDKWILRSENGRITRRRKSPKHGRSEHMFNELIYIPHLLNNPSFSLQILFVDEEETWVNDGSGSWRRKGWRITDRSLIRVRSSRIFFTTDDYCSLLPNGLPPVFTATDLAEHAQLPRNLARKMAYTLRKSGMLYMHGRQNRAYCYSLSQP